MLANLAMAIERAGQRRRFEHRNTVLRSQFTNAQRNLPRPFSQHLRRAHFFIVVL